MKTAVNTIFLAVLALCAASCIYDFNAELSSDEKHFLVIEGDILAGGVTDVTVSFSDSLQYRGGTNYITTADVYVETESGIRFAGVPDSDSGYSIDTGALPLDEKCRLVVGYGDTYASEWLLPLVTPPVDSVTYCVDGSELKIKVNTHSDTDNRYYMWQADEDWEYHADMYATHWFRKGSSIVMDEIVQFENGENTYYCWDSDRVTDLMIYSTANLSGNSVSDLVLYSIAKDDLKISYIYSVLVTQKSISEEAYLYYENLSRNSDDVGTLFSPQPAEMRGNITNLSDPDELVLGFISAVVPSSQRIFISDGDTHFYKSSEKYESIEPYVSTRTEWRSLYNRGYYVLDIYSDPMNPFADTGTEDPPYEWVPRKCVDCTMKGGGKNKPDWWPTYHK